MQYNRIIIISKCYNSSTSGPANVVRELINNMELENVNYIPILLTEDVSKIKFVKEVARTIISEKESIINVHTDGFFIPLMVYLFSKINKKNKYYLTVHGIHQIQGDRTQKGYLKYEFIEKILYSNFPNLICVSEMLKDDINLIFGRNNNILVIPNATEARSKKKYCEITADKTLDLISLGGLRSVKGFDELISLAKFLRDNGVKFNISIYGSDEGRLNAFNDILEKEQLINTITYFGNQVDRQKIYDLIVGSDFQLCLSKYDTYNVAIAESLVLGCPVVATSKCGASYLIVDGENGIVVNLERQDKYEKILRYINSFYDDCKMRKRVYENREKYVEQLSWKSIVSQYENLGVDG